MGCRWLFYTFMFFIVPFTGTTVLSNFSWLVQHTLETDLNDNSVQSLDVFEAIFQKNTDALAGLCAQKTTMSIRNMYQQTPLIVAVKSGCIEILDLVLKVRDIDINAIDCYGKTALDYASELYVGKDISSEQLIIRQVVCSKLIAKKAKTSTVKYSEFVRNVMYPDAALSKQIEVSFAGCPMLLDSCNYTMWQIHDSDQYKKSYKMTDQELEKSLAARDNAQVFVSKKDIENLKRLIIDYSGKSDKVFDDLAKVIHVIDQYGQISLQYIADFYNQKIVWFYLSEEQGNYLCWRFSGLKNGSGCADNAAVLGKTFQSIIPNSSIPECMKKQGVSWISYGGVGVAQANIRHVRNAYVQLKPQKSRHLALLVE